MLAAIPSVVLGLWGILVLGPFLGQHVEPWLHDHLGFIPIFGAPSATGTGMFTAGLILTIMVVPIIASICRELFLQVPSELEEGALALGATRWEMVRGVDPAVDATGIAAAIILGLGRALGEAIAVTQVIGGGTKINTHLRAERHAREQDRRELPGRVDRVSRRRRSSTSPRSCSSSGL